jgi:hypothetical protein
MAASAAAPPPLPNHTNGGGETRYACISYFWTIIVYSHPLLYLILCLNRNCAEVKIIQDPNIAVPAPPSAPPVTAPTIPTASSSTSVVTTPTITTTQSTTSAIASSSSSSSSSPATHGKTIVGYYAVSSDIFPSVGFALIGSRTTFSHYLPLSNLMCRVGNGMIETKRRLLRIWTLQNFREVRRTIYSKFFSLHRSCYI